jgi:hypothetical protein
LRLLANLRSALESGRLVLPRTGLWLELRRQLLGYKLNDKKLQTDAVMALVVAVRMALRSSGQGGTTLRFDYFNDPLPSRPPAAVDSPERQPRRYVDDRVLRLDSLTTASVARIGSPFSKR